MRYDVKVISQDQPVVAQHGDVLVASTGSYLLLGPWGEILTVCGAGAGDRWTGN